MADVAPGTPVESGAVALPAFTRDPAAEARAEAIAFGLFSLEAPFAEATPAGWRRLPDRPRDLFMARARFVLASAEEYRP